MRSNSTVPELITPSSMSIDATGPPPGAGFLTTVYPAEIAIEGLAMGVIAMIPMQGPAIEGFAMGSIVYVGGMEGPTIEGFAIGVIAFKT